MTRKRNRINGEGSVRKRQDGSWEARYTAGYTPEGKQVTRSLYGRTRAAVTEKLQAALAQQPKGATILTEQGKLTLAGQLAAHLEQRTPELSPGTVIKLRSYLKIIEENSVGGVPLRDLKPAHLEAFYRELAAKYAPGTVRHISIFLKQGLKKALRHELITRNPGDVAELPRMKERERPGVQLEPEQLAAVLAAAQHHRLYPLFATIATLGLRHSEALGLQWSDIDFATGTLDIRRTVVSRGGLPALSEPKTSASMRTLYLSEELKDVLLDWRTSIGGSEWVFPSMTGGMLGQHNVRRVWRQILTEAGVPTKTRIHDLRGAFLARLIESGADPRTTADLAGHSDPRMTLKVYAYSRAENRKAALLASAGNVLPKATKKAD